ncbi:hypothetical protein [Rathayibacter agropyri]
MFASTFATMSARRLIVALDEVRRVRPRDSIDMEVSESVRAALAALDRGRPRGAVVLASAFDPILASVLTARCQSALVVRYELHGPEPQDCDLFVAHARTMVR